MGLVKDLKIQGFSQIEIPSSHDDFYQLVKAYREFDSQTPQKEKTSTHLMIDQNDDINYGYVPRKKSNGFDEKSYFHFHPRILELNQLPNNQLYQQFLINANKIFSPMEMLIKQTLLELQEHGHIDTKNLLDEKDNPSVIMRVLNYKPHKETLMLAKPHVDRGVLTIAGYETDPGLEMIHNNAVYPIQSQNKKANLFVAPKLKDNSNLKLPGTVHQVRNLGNNLQRGSVVFFIDENVNSELLKKYF